MRYITTRPITIPAGTEFKVSHELGPGGLEAMLEQGLMRVFVGRSAALSEGMIKARPDLYVVTHEPSR